MYQVNIGNKILYYPGSEEAQIFATELNEEIGLAGEFKFEVPPDNPVYSELSNGKLVTILKNGDEYWRGEIRDVKTDFAKIASVYVVEDLAWLADEYMTPAQITNETNAQRLQAAITAYNSVRSATPERQFFAGYITNVSSSGICNWTTEYEWSILESLRNCIANSASEPGYIRVRRQKENGVIKRYIDIVKLSDYGVASDQPIEYGYNLLDYVKDSDYGNLTNVLTPYGEELENQEVYEDYAQRLQGNTITNAASVSAYGRHAKAVVFDGVTDATTLNALAASYLSRYCQPQLTMEVQAVDLAEIESADAIKLGDSVQIIAKPFAIDQRLYLTQIRRDIQNIDKNVITMSGHVLTGKTLTSQLVGTAKAVENIPSESSILKAAKKNALAMLLDETQGGYVVFEYYDNDSKIQALDICSAATIAQSLKRWKWCLKGLGYMERQNTGASWPSDADLPVAITMDGAIVADFLTVGMIKLCGAAKNGSSSKLNPAANAFLKVYNGSTEIGRWGSDGIWVRKGAIDLGPLINSEGTFHVDDNGYMKLRKGFIQIGTKVGNRYPFYVDDNGNLQATNADITGSITVGGSNNTNGSIKVKNSGGSDVITLNNNGMLAESNCIAVIGGGYIKHHENDTGTSNQWVFDLGCKYCNCEYEDDGWHWVNGGATKIYKYLEGAYNPSDQRSKTEIEPLNQEMSKDLIMRTHPKMFEFKHKRGVKMFGMIAQDVVEELEDIGFTEKNGLINIPEDPDEWMSIEYKQYIPHLINVVQMQQAQIDELKEELMKLKGETNG